MLPVLFFKSHVKAHLRKEGAFVCGYRTKTQKVRKRKPKADAAVW